MGCLIVIVPEELQAVKRAEKTIRINKRRTEWLIILPPCKKVFPNLIAPMVPITQWLEKHIPSNHLT
jgi:hypothetical protein